MLSLQEEENQEKADRDVQDFDEALIECQPLQKLRGALVQPLHEGINTISSTIIQHQFLPLCSPQTRRIVGYHATIEYSDGVPRTRLN
jgi:hypothetical protein